MAQRVYRLLHFSDGTAYAEESSDSEAIEPSDKQEQEVESAGGLDIASTSQASSEHGAADDQPLCQPVREIDCNLKGPRGKRLSEKRQVASADDEDLRSAESPRDQLACRHESLTHEEAEVGPRSQCVKGQVISMK
ncbi:unnamed protein product [Protopolystoma xenopodis]|uniref:Uncharacterized protein n=1 Tax=Protopolystoma xenopodis TaxID=117903 RepID=A0A448WL61_9PLAT|nr:unnamed protein product [Protopolystoma xenopodis]